MSEGNKKYYELLSERFHWCIDCGYIGGEHEGAYCEDCQDYWRKLREAREEENNKEHEYV